MASALAIMSCPYKKPSYSPEFLTENITHAHFSYLILFFLELLPLQRRLLSVGTDDLYLHRNPNKGPQPLQTVIMLIAGVVLLVIAGSLCSLCNKDRDNLSE